VLGQRRKSRLLLYASGIAAGLGFYTFFSARATLLILLLFVLTQRHRWEKLRRLWPLALGAAATITPLLVATGGSVITAMTSQAGAEQGSLLERRVSNLWIDGLAFHFSSWTSHWVSGPLLDPISGVLLAFGIAVALVGIRLESMRLLLIWAAIALLVTGILSPYDHPTVTRLHYCLPPLALLGGFGAKAVWRTVRQVPALTLRRYSYYCSGPCSS
jgi:4-amino-4-deoxy-L-arabinose transferase-like glycosyltransferase